MNVLFLCIAMHGSLTIQRYPYIQVTTVGTMNEISHSHVPVKMVSGHKSLKSQNFLWTDSMMQACSVCYKALDANL